MVDVFILISVIWVFISSNLYRLWLPAMLTATTQPFHGMDNGISKSLKQCFGSVTFWYRSGSSSGSCSFCEWPLDANKKGSFAYCFLKVHLQFTSFFKDKKSERSKKINQDFSCYFASWWKVPDPDPCLWIVNNGSGSVTLLVSVSFTTIVLWGIKYFLFHYLFFVIKIFSLKILVMKHVVTWQYFRQTKNLLLFWKIVATHFGGETHFSFRSMQFLFETFSFRE